MKEKIKGALLDLLFYSIAFTIALIPFIFIDNKLLATAVFTAIATFILFIFSIPFKDVSIYDPYWSVAPLVMLLINMIKYHLWNINSFILLIVIGFWSIRLTINWLITYKGLGHEDWRYAMYRNKYPAFIFQVISFVGLHFVPTIVVYLGMVNALFAIEVSEFSYFSIIGIVISLLATILEIISDKAVHQFLKDHAGEKRCCNYSVWKYSRHPNYLGEMSFWLGLFLYFIFIRLDVWYFGLGFLTIIILFLVVSIPMMERHNKERRIDYEEYKATTSVLLLLPRRKPKQ